MLRQLRQHFNRRQPHNQQQFFLATDLSLLPTPGYQLRVNFAIFARD